MTNFLVLYRGNTITDAKMIAVSIDPEVIAYVAERLVRNEQTTEDDDVVLSAIHTGRKRALRLVRTEAAQ